MRQNTLFWLDIPLGCIKLHVNKILRIAFTLEKLRVMIKHYEKLNGVNYMKLFQKTGSCRFFNKRDNIINQLMFFYIYYDSHKE